MLEKCKGCEIHNKTIFKKQCYFEIDRKDISSILVDSKKKIHVNQYNLLKTLNSHGHKSQTTAINKPLILRQD